MSIAPSNIELRQAETDGHPAAEEIAPGAAGPGTVAPPFAQNQLLAPTSAETREGEDARIGHLGEC